MDCADCAAKLEHALADLPGVIEARVNFSTARVQIDYLPDKTNESAIKALIRDFGYSVTGDKMPEHRYKIDGLDCPNCALELEESIKGLPGAVAAEVSFATGTLKVTGSVPRSSVEGVVREHGYSLASTLERADSDVPWWQEPQFRNTAIGGFLILTALALQLLAWGTFPARVLFVASMVISGWETIHAAAGALKHGFALDENFLMTIAAIGAIGIGEWFEGAIVVFLFSLGDALEEATMEHTRRSISSLMDLGPKTAIVLKDGQETEVPVAELEPGDIVLVKPGTRLPVDGKVQKGQSTVNQAPVTGESIPVAKAPGDDVFAGTLNEFGALEISVTREASDSTLARIIHMVEEAQEQKATSERLVTRFARYYTPIVVGLAVLIAAVPPLVLHAAWQPWIYRALTLLLVSCPCALVISTPVTVVAAIGNAGRYGVLIKGGSHLETAGAIQAIAFDKTGTLTAGQPEVTDIVAGAGRTESEVLGRAAAVEARSEHLLAEAIVRAAEQKQISFEPGEHFAALAGNGAKAHTVGGTTYTASTRFARENLNLSLSGFDHDITRLEQAGKTIVTVCSQGEVLGLIALADQVRPEAPQAIRSLKQIGIKQAVMLTGDRAATAAAIARAAGIDDVRAELLPENKVTAVAEMVDKYGSVAMVGDGINDAPALARATLGIAMGGAGTDAALETADIALMGDDLGRVAYAMRLSRRALRTIKQNITFSLVVKFISLILIFPGWLSLWLAIMADTGTSLVVIANGMRMLRVKPGQESGVRSGDGCLSTKVPKYQSTKVPKYRK
jgi:Cd2+/Zn2+-exporting ATPase